MDTIFILGSLFQSRCGEGGMLQRNNTGVCSQCLSPTGHAPSHGTHHSGSTLVHWEPSEAGPRLHAPPRSKPPRLGSQVALTPEAQIRLGLRFVPFPGPSSSGDGVFGERGRCDLSPLPSLLLGFLGVPLAHLLRRMVTVQSPKKA